MSDERFLPYGRQTIEQDDIDAVVEVLRGDWLTTGPAIERFESALASAVGAEAAVAVANGTAALHAACYAAGVGPGDEVIVPAVSFLATANCARYLGAEPVFADVDAATGLVSCEDVERHVSEKTRAIIPVHLNGRPADMASLEKITASSGACLIEDAAHALGATIEGDRVGRCTGRSGMTMFSFHPVKQITTGEGGAVTVNDPDLLHRLRLFRNHGMVHDESALESTSPGPWYYEQQELGHNLRMTDMQAALGVSQLGKLQRFVARRRLLARRYDELLNPVAGIEPVIPSSAADGCAYHLYAVHVDFEALGIERAELMARLRERGIGTQVHFIPIPQQPYYARRGCRIEEYPGAVSYYERVLSLPLFPGMHDSDVERVVGALRELINP